MELDIDLTKTNENVEVKAAYDAAGSLRIGYARMTKEDFEMLKALVQSPHWAFYRRLLIAAMGEYQRSSWAVTGVDSVVKMIHSNGISAGINFAINQAQVLCTEYDKQNQKNIEKPTKADIPFKRG